MIVDTHCHLYFNLFDQDRSEVLANAWQAGISHILLPGIDLPSSREAVRLADTDPRLFAAVGVHPNDSLSWDENSLNELRRLAAHPKVVAIGEIGLDYYREHAPHDVQQRILQIQLELACETGLPVILHNRASRQDLWKIISDWLDQLPHNSPLENHPGVFHSFDGTLEEANQTTSRRFALGISGPVTFKNALDRQALVREIDLNHILIETDAPFLAPQPHRGRRNEPAYVRYVAEKIADLHQQPMIEIENITSQNAARLFKWDTID